MSLLGSWAVVAVTTFAIIFAALYYHRVHAYTYWKKKNVPQIKPKYPFVDFIKIILGKTSVMRMFNTGYDEFKKTGYGGVYQSKPALLVCDPDLIQYFLTKEFSSFHDHTDVYDTDNDPLSANLFNLSGERWRTLRAKLSPTFTSGKIKGMFPLIEECVQELKESIREESKKKNGSVELLDLLMRFCADVIGTCAFGIKCNSLKNPDAEFQHMGREMVRSTFKTFFQFFILTKIPKLKRSVTARRLFPKTTAFFSDLMSNTVKYRKENNVERNDFVQLLMKIADEEKDEKIFNPDIMTAQGTIFFIAGLDNVANQIGFCLHHLAVDPAVQERVHNEVTSVLEEFGGRMCYEALKKMDLVDRVFDESMRLHSPLASLFRAMTAERYVIPGTDVVLEKGIIVLIPVEHIHMDEKYYPEPEKFDPGRFTEEEKAKRHPYAYLPFGGGPRFCIASRFAKLEMSLCFTELVRHFKFSVAPETDLYLELEPKSFGPSPKNKFWLKVTECNDTFCFQCSCGRF